jgi:hypothetical protein
MDREHISAGGLRAAAGRRQLAAPYAFDLECVSTLRGLVIGGKLPADEASVRWNCLA